MSLKSRLVKKKKELKDRSSGNSQVIFQKEGTLRVRILPVGEEKEFIAEVETFYLGEKLKGYFSPHSIGLPCAVYEKYEELKNSKDPEDKELAKTLIPRLKPLCGVLVYTDEKGKEVDTEKSGKLIQLANNQYQEIIDLFLDEDEWGDMTNPVNGYDIKLGRTGKGKLDTEYTVSPCKNTPIPKGWGKKLFNLEEAVKKLFPTYEQSVEILNQFLNTSGPSGDDMEDESPKMKMKKKLKKKISKY